MTQILCFMIELGKTRLITAMKNFSSWLVGIFVENTKQQKQKMVPDTQWDRKDAKNAIFSLIGREFGVLVVILS
ncbi:MAG: hypothetical protein ACE5DL_01735 [Nitrosopumilaceae archaeon]